MQIKSPTKRFYFCHQKLSFCSSTKALFNDLIFILFEYQTIYVINYNQEFVKSILNFKVFLWVFFYSEIFKRILIKDLRFACKACLNPWVSSAAFFISKDLHIYTFRKCLITYKRHVIN